MTAKEKKKFKTPEGWIKPQLQLLGMDGSAFSIMGHFRNAAQKAGNKKESIDAVLAECRSGDYDHLLQTVMKHIDQSKPKNRESYIECPHCGKWTDKDGEMIEECARCGDLFESSYLDGSGLCEPCAWDEEQDGKEECVDCGGDYDEIDLDADGVCPCCARERESGE